MGAQSDSRPNPSVAACVRSVLKYRSQSVSAVAVATMLSMPVLADTAPADDAATLQEVVVTGIRYQLQTSQTRKENADEIVDSVTAEDIGALPDRSVSEVLQRIPGIAISRLPDPRDTDRVVTEGSGVTIRGLGWVRSELNGRSAFSAKNSRVLGFEDIPPELMAGVDVYKDPSAQQIEGGISGTVNLRTRLPFDSTERKFAFSVEGQRGDLAKVTKPTESLLYSDRWSTGIGDIGFLASATNSKLVSRTDTIEVDQYYPRTDLVPGQTVYATGGIGFRTLTVDRERTGVSSALQWSSPERTVDAALQYFYTHATWNEDEDALPNAGNAGLSGTNLTFSNGFLTGGSINDAGWNGDTRYTQRESNNDDLGLHVNWHPTEHLHLETDIQHSRANTKGYDLTVGTNFGPNYENAGPWGLQLNGSDPPTITVPSSARSQLVDPNLLYTSFAMDYHQHNNADAWAYRADGDYTFDNSSWLDKVRFGVRYEDYKSVTREADYNWGAVSFPWGGGTEVATASAFQGILPYVQQNFPNWFHGGSAPTSYLFVAPSVLHNFNNFVNIYNQICAAGVKPCGWTPFNGDYGDRIPTPGALGVNPQEQKSYAGYGQLSFKHGQFDGNVGVRLVHTSTSATAFEKFDPFNGDLTAVSADIVAFSNGGAVTQTGGTSYTDVLPSLNLRFKATDKVFVRFAMDKSIYRPDFSQITPSIEVNTHAGYIVGGVCTPTVPSGIAGNCLYDYTAHAGNANLKPMQSWNFDLSTEWYMNDTNSLVGAIFDKQIRGFLEDTDSVVPFTNNGVTQNVLVTRPENQGAGYVRGYELAWNGFFTYLPSFLKNFGARASFTYVTSAGTRNSSANPYDPQQVTGAQVKGYPLEGLSKRTYDVELYYSVQAVEARLAYNWRSRYVLTTDAANINLPVWQEDYGQLDGSVQWRFYKGLTLGFEVVNITDAKLKQLVDNLNGAGLTPRSWVDSDRRFGIFLRGNF
jgi:TonB-dependent receptor